MSELIKNAKVYATQAHQRIDQRRKFNNLPYHVHLEAVADLVASVTDNEEMIAAAWLHDVVEDTPATLEDVEKEFGKNVAQLVKELTDISRPSDGNRAKRKAIDRDHIAKASSRAKTIKLADLIHNSRDITQHDPHFARVYLSEMSALLNVLGNGDSKLYKQARDTHGACLKKLGPVTEHHEYVVNPKPKAEFFSAVSQPHFKRLFAELFSAKDIADPLLSFDADKATAEVAKALDTYQQEVASVRIHGAVRGYLQKVDIVNGSNEACAQQIRHFTVDQVVSGDSPVSDVIHILTRHNYCFVEMLGDIVGVIDRGSINKPLVRMWLFGIMTLIEIRLIDLIELHFPEQSWEVEITNNRLEKARAIHEDRQRRGQHSRLIDCLQLSDKIQIMLSHQPTFDSMEFESKKSGKRVAKEMEQLRNHLAHAQDIAEHNWAQIVRLAQIIDELTGDQ
ncbi:HD domain-containing protein [Kaarinaea lacus]